MLSDNDSDGYIPPSPEYYPDSPEPYTPGSPVDYSSGSSRSSTAGSTIPEERENDDIVTASPTTPSEFDKSGKDNDSDEKKEDEEEDEVEWEAYEDDKGRTYYYNPSTGESRWEKPARYKYVEMPTKDDEASVSRSPAYDIEEEEGEEADEGRDESMNEAFAVDDYWIEYRDEQGRTYYYNSNTETTQWERPHGVSNIQKDDTASSIAEKYDSIALPKDDENSEVETTKEVLDEGTPVTEKYSIQDMESIEEKTSENDPVTAAIDALNAMDAILEPSCSTHVTDLVTHAGPNEGYAKAIQCLSNSFHGQTAICGLLCSWIRTLTSSSTGNSSNSANTSTAIATPHTIMDSIRTIVEKVIHGIVLENYSKEKDENILRLRKREVQFLEDMMDSDRWRRLLIDLSTKHKDSALLMFCLKSMSRRGHHREIAQHNQSDYFGVFDSMLNFEVSIIGRPWEDDLTATIGKNILDTCTSTEYTYLHSMESVEDLIQRSTKMYTDKSTECSDKERKGLQGAVRRWTRLKEDLEGAMIVSSNGGSTLVRKRRINLALTASELYQRQRRRLNPFTTSSVTSLDAEKKDKWKDLLDSAVMTLIRRYCTGMPFDVLLLDKLINPKNDDLISQEQHGAYVGQSLLSNPTAINALVSTLYKTGGTVVKSQDLKEKCAALLAHAVLAAEKDCGLSSEAKGQEFSDENNTFNEMQKDIIRGSELCDQVGNMMSFVVLDDERAPQTSVGVQLSVLCIRRAAVAKGVILWATDILKGSEFCLSAAYPSLTPCILSLVRIIVARHPFTREGALTIALTVLFDHPIPEDMSYQKVESLKKQSLRLLLSLCCLGQAIHVFRSLLGRLNGGSTAIDSSLIRYFIGGCSEVFYPPFSVPFIKCFSSLLASAPCVEALCSTGFEKGRMIALQGIIQSAVSMLDERTVSDLFTQNERHTISTLAEIFGKMSDVQLVERS